MNKLFLKAFIITIAIIFCPLIKCSEPSKNEQELQATLFTYPFLHNPHKRGAFIHQLIKKGKTTELQRVLYFCKQCGLNSLINMPNQRGQTFMHYAAKACRTRCLQILIDNGANIDAKDYAGWTPLHYAVATDKRGNKKRNQTVKLLCEAGADKTIIDRSVRSAREIALSLSRDEAAYLIMTTNKKS